MNKPTFKEFLFINHDAIVKSSDGHYYIRKQTHRFNIPRGVSYVLSFLLIFGINQFISHNNLWRNTGFDFVLIFLLFYFLFLRIQYHFTTFENVDETFDDPVIFPESPKTLTTRKFSIYMILLSIFTLVILLNSFSAMYIRSLFEDQHNISNMSVRLSFVEDAKGIEFSDCENLTELSIPDAEVTDIDISADISGSPSPYQFRLNGKLLSDIHCYKSGSYIWDKEIFKQECYGSSDVDDLPDNSVLEISSGTYSRQWIIKTKA